MYVHVCDGRHFYGSQKTHLGRLFSTFYFLGQGLPCVFCSTARWPMCFQISCLHRLIAESWDDRRMAFCFSFSYGLWGLISDGQAIGFICKAIPKAQSFAFDFLLAVVTFLSQLPCLWAGKGGNFHSEWRKESSLMEKWDSSCQWRWEHESCCRGSWDWSLSLTLWGR